MNTQLKKDTTIMAKLRNFMLLCLCALVMVPALRAEHLMIIAVNDTHSQIDPASDGKGGVARRRAIYDQLRSQNPNTVLIHAGDAVQGTLFFSLYRGEVEYALMDTLGYDAIILGNHEFDNGMEELAAHYRNGDAVKISANYDFSATPLNGLFQPYWIKAVGDKRVAFFGINVNPTGLIADMNCVNLRYSFAPSVQSWCPTSATAAMSPPSPMTRSSSPRAATLTWSSAAIPTPPSSQAAAWIASAMPTAN